MFKCPNCGTQNVHRDGEYCIFCEPGEIKTDGTVNE